MSKKQKTLFESWNQCASKGNQGIPKKNDTRNLPSTSPFNSPSHNVFQPNTFSRTESLLVDGGFDHEAGRTWIYPTNYPVRDYQFSIVQEALFRNTLVILPTGLGKTFIAAVVMYNIYRWYPKGKVIFMAPTRPLVAQQIEACYKVTGISPADTTQMTGTNMPEERKRMWAKKRVFFLTPQVLGNDLVRNICAADSIKCVVVDEAHKALGNHAYCQVIRELQAHTTQFRILALTATPGSDTQAVKMVLSNLLISHVEMRSEDSDDVKEYTHIRDIEKIVVPLGDRLLSIKSRFLDVINIYLKRLSQRRVMSTKNPSSLSKYQVLKLREEFTQHPPERISKFDYGLALADFSLCISLYHAYELLLLHGARPFYNFLSGILNGDKSIPHTRAELLKNYDFEELMKEVQDNYVTESVRNGPDIKMGANGTRVLPGHPKLEKLLEIVLRHFRTTNKDSVTSTRVMIFSQYRDSVDEIVEMLNHHQPMIKVMSFIGQSSKSATSVGYSQKHQLKVLQDFRVGGYNTLVSTCVGEEGLDIGEVDLIVCYDCPKSPIRLVQRMGRTGRLRKGRIVILVAEGKEEQMYNSCESKKKAVYRAISKGSAFTQLYHNSPSLIPTGIKPTCVKTIVKVETLTPFSKMKGKPQESAFLNEGELLEFNNYFKVPKSASPLLLESKFVSFKNEEQIENGQDNSTVTSNRTTQLREPRLSLSKWMLWQTTPQRTHMVSHSSRSLLLIETMEKTNFLNVGNQSQGETFQQNISLSTVVRPNIPNSISSNHHKQLSKENLSPPLVDLCSDDDFGELQDMDIEPIQEINDRLCPSKCLKINANEKGEIPFLKTLLNHGTTPLPRYQGGNLLKTLFGIESLNLPCKASSCILKPPPVISDNLTVESFSGVLIEPDPPIEPKNCILRVLNNKMKARLKRKTRELGIKLSFSIIEGRLDTFIRENITCDSSLMSQAKTNIPSFDVSFRSLSPMEAVNSKSDTDVEQSLLPKGITFDIDFDIPEVFEDKFSDEIDIVPSSPSQCATKCDIPKPNEKQHRDADSFDVDSSLIFEQFFSSKDDDIADKLEASFCSPLMIKKVVFESNSSSTQGLQKNIPKHKILNLDKSHRSSIERKQHDIKNNESTQYSLTQLVSFIDNTEHVDKINNIEGFETDLDVTLKNADENESSDEEIEPTPPKELIPVSSKFCYRTNSANFDSDFVQKECRIGNEQKRPTSPFVLNSKISSDLLLTPTKTKNKNPNTERTTKVKHSNQEKFICDPKMENVTKSVNFSKDTSLDLAEMHYLPPSTSNRSNAEFEEFNKLNDLDKNRASYVQEQTALSWPKKLNSKISFDLSKIQFSPIEGPKENAKTCVEQEISFYNKSSLEESEQNVLNRRISSSPIKPDTSISFDLSDVQFSPEEKCVKGTRQNMPITKLTTKIEQLNSNISFDLSDEKFSFCSKAKTNIASATESKREGKNKFIEQAEQSLSRKTSNPAISKTNVSFDLSNIKFSPHCHVEEINKESNLKEESASKNLISVEHMDPNTSFESPTLDKVFFDISFDLPDLKYDSSPNIVECAEPKVNIVPEKPSLGNSEQCRFPSNFTTKSDNFSAAQTSSHRKTSILHNSVVNPLEKFNLTRESEYPNVSKPPSKDLQSQSFQLLKTKQHVIPHGSNITMHAERNSDITHISDCKANFPLLQQSPESPNVFALGKKRKRHNVLNDTTLVSPPVRNNEIDDFVQPANKINPEATGLYKRTRHKGGGRNKFLLTQAAVSGTESSCDDIDDDEDAMDASFINDNTVLESPLNQRAMYLQSVKDIVGLPQKFKLKEGSNRNDQISSQPYEEGSEYMFDSFCVDDEEVLFTSSSDEAEVSFEVTKAKNNKKKRKRIIAINDNSSSEEEFVKKIKSSEDDEEIFVRKLTTESNSLNKERKILFSPIKLVGTQNNKTATISDLKSVHKLSKPSCSKTTYNTVVSNVQTQKQSISNHQVVNFSKPVKPLFESVKSFSRSDSEYANPSVSKSNEDLIDMDKYENFAFDVGWDDDPEPHFQNMENDIEPNHPKINNPNFQTIADASTSSHTNQLQSGRPEDVITTGATNRKCSTQVVSCLNSSASSTVKTILVDSRELASGKPVISALRNKYGVNPFVMQLVSADYILSNKVAVERILDSDFPSFGLPMKLIDKVRAMSELYEKCFVIIEKDCRKRAIGFNKFSTKYLQFAVYANLHPSIRVLYSNSVDDTASIVYDIIEKERKKGLHIDIPVVLNSSSQKLYDFYLSLPHVSPICALNFVYQFPTVKSFCKGSVDQLKKAGFISTRKATALLHFLSSELLIASFS